MPDTEWRVIPDFPGYVISETGEVRELQSNRIIAAETGDHRESVRLRRDGKQYRRGVRKLVSRMYDTHHNYSGYHPVPGFETYEANSDGFVRKIGSTKHLKERTDSGTYYILFRNGQRHKRSINSIIQDIERAYYG